MNHSLKLNALYFFVMAATPQVASAHLKPCPPDLQSELLKNLENANVGNDTEIRASSATELSHLAIKLIDASEHIELKKLYYTHPLIIQKALEQVEKDSEKHQCLSRLQLEASAFQNGPLKLYKKIITFSKSAGSALTLGAIIFLIRHFSNSRKK
jgi:hypothetical protein